MIIKIGRYFRFPGKAKKKPHKRKKCRTREQFYIKCFYIGSTNIKPVMWEMENEIEVMESFIQFVKPIETALFFPLFILGATELPSQALLRGLEPKREVKEVELKEPEAVRLRSEKTRERAKIFGMWAGGF